MPKDIVKSNLQSCSNYASKSSKKRRHSESEVLAGIRSRVAVRSPSDVPDGSNNRMEDIPEGVLYGEHNDPSEERHLETQTEEEKEILEALSGLLSEDGEISRRRIDSRRWNTFTKT